MNITMPMKRTYKKKAPRRRAYRKRAPRRYNRVKEVASAQYTTGTALLQPAQSMSNGAYAFRNFSLDAASQRIQNIAQGYQEYRIKKVTWQVKGFFDTFPAATTATAPTVPHLYWRTDKLGSYNVDSTLTTLKASGCRPVRLDDKIITRSFRPVVLQGVATSAGSATDAPVLSVGSYKTSPWLPTNGNAYVANKTEWAASSIDHLGLLIAIDCDVVPFASVASIQFTVEFEFRKPLDDIDPNGESVMEVVDIADLQPKKPTPPEVV